MWVFVAEDHGVMGLCQSSFTVVFRMSRMQAPRAKTVIFGS